MFKFQNIVELQFIIQRAALFFSLRNNKLDAVIISHFNYVSNAGYE